MATGLDQVAGVGMIGLARSIFLYYTIWVILLPFVDSSHTIHQYFLPRAYAVGIPIVAGVALLMAIGLFTGIMVIKSKNPKQKTS